MKAIRVYEPGSEQVLRYEEVPEPKPGPGEALVKLEAIGVNYIDIYYRLGQYKAPLPFTSGMEGAGVVKAVGENVHEVKVGERVAYAGSLGAYAECALVPAWKLIEIPEKVDANLAAAVMLQGMTAHYLTHSTYPVKPGDVILVHAAAGGVGLLLIQMAKQRRARVLGTVSTEEKGRVAKEAGADEIILYTKEDFEVRVKHLTSNRGVQVVYDSVGQSTFDKSLNCLVPRGYLVLFGQSSGPVPPSDPQLLSQRGSLYLTRPALFHYTSTREELLSRSSDVFKWVAEGKLRVRIDQSVPLAQAALAHQRLASRQTTGKILLIP